MKYFMMLIMSFGAILAADLNIKGDVTINGKKATSNMKVNLNDFITTGKKSKVTFKIGKNAFMAKENTRFAVEEHNGAKSLKVVTGGVLAVFKKGEKYKLQTKNMTAGIRGTGIYMERRDGKTYFCTCYGETEVHSHKEHKNLEATHHNMIWVKEDGTIKAAKEMKDHTDDDLRELEAMVGRVPDFDK
jgi:hypothetical protein